MVCGRVRSCVVCGRGEGDVWHVGEMMCSIYVGRGKRNKFVPECLIP